MKKLEDIPKQEIFNVPKGYFDNLPNVVQSRIEKKNAHTLQPNFRIAWGYALPVVVMLAIGAFWFTSTNKQTPDSEIMLAEVSTEDLIIFLNIAEISTDELLENELLDDVDATQIENEVYQYNFDTNDRESIIDELDLNTL